MWSLTDYRHSWICNTDSSGDDESTGGKENEKKEENAGTKPLPTLRLVKEVSLSSLGNIGRNSYLAAAAAAAARVFSLLLYSHTKQQVSSHIYLQEPEDDGPVTYATHEDAVEAFKKMLTDHGVSSTVKFNECQKSLSKDRRWGILKTGERKQVSGWVGW